MSQVGKKLFSRIISGKDLSLFVNILISKIRPIVCTVDGGIIQISPEPETISLAAFYGKIYLSRTCFENKTILVRKIDLSDSKYIHTWFEKFTYLARKI
jgi:hypothetical protein